MADRLSDGTARPEEGIDEAQPAIEQLSPQSDLHKAVLEKTLQRLRMSERVMAKMYTRWQASEKRIQAYIDLPDYEAKLKDMARLKGPPEITSIVVPYSYATIWTIVTYLVHTFAGRKPIFQVESYSKESIGKAPNMETMLQYNADHARLIDAMVQWFLDGETYGCGIVRTLWKEEWGYRTSFQNGSPLGMAAPNMPKQNLSTRVKKLTYEGNNIENIDPFLFFPDPRVPMKKVNTKGEFVFWRSFEGEHTLKREQYNGNLMWVEEGAKARTAQAQSGGTSPSQSVRGLAIGAESTPGSPFRGDTIGGLPFHQIDQGTVDLIPKDWGLGDGEEPEKWLFSIMNYNQIVQAERLDLDHGRHPVSVIEPGSFGYGFGQPGSADMLGPIQDALSWFINSHIYNVRSTLNNMFLVDPSMVEMQDLKDQGPGKIIRIKRAAYGQDVRQFLTQLQVQDVTATHIRDMDMFMRMGDALSAVNDNLKGIQEDGGRKTATEVRTAGEAGASRLAARARYISAHGMVDLAEQMSLNIQQNQTMEFFLKVVGQEGMKNPITIGPQELAGDFYFPVHDGTLPLDRVAMLEVWKEIFMAISQNQLLMQRYDLDGIFQYMAELGGAKNLSNFHQLPAGEGQPAGVSVQPDEALDQNVQRGNAVPIRGPGAALVPGQTRPTTGLATG